MITIEFQAARLRPMCQWNEQFREFCPKAFDTILKPLIRERKPQPFAVQSIFSTWLDKE